MSDPRKYPARQTEALLRELLEKEKKETQYLRKMVDFWIQKYEETEDKWKAEIKYMTGAED